MDDLNVIDQFTTTFVTYIDSGFGLLGADVAFLTSILIGIDITLAGLFWAIAEDKAVIPALIRKVLYVGAFAYILNNFKLLANIIFESFAGLGLQAANTSLSIGDLMRPGFIAATGYQAAEPLLDEVSNLVGPVAFFTNFPLIAVLMISWAIVLVAFFILAIQLFMTILEFKLTTLAGFVLVPFALWNRTSFLAEKVLGNVIAAGIKLMVLAIIIGIGATIFGSFTAAISPGSITMEQALSSVLAALSLLMLGIFGPGIAAGLISGAPQLGAGAVAGTALGVGIGAAAAGRAGFAGGQMAATGAGSGVRAGSSLAGGAATSFTMARNASGKTGAAGVMAGVSGMAQAGAGALGGGVGNMAERATSGVRSAYQQGARSAYQATGGELAGNSPAMPAPAPDPTPSWAQRLQKQQHRQHRRDTAVMLAHTLREGDRPGGADSPKLKDTDE